MQRGRSALCFGWKALSGLGAAASGIEHRRGRLVGDELRGGFQAFEQAGERARAQATKRCGRHSWPGWIGPIAGLTGIDLA